MKTNPTSIHETAKREKLQRAYVSASNRIAHWSQDHPDPLWAGIRIDPAKIDTDLGEALLDVLIAGSLDMPGPEIAEHLHISLPAVDSRKKRLLEKLNAKTFTGCVAIALRLKLIP